MAAAAAVLATAPRPVHAQDAPAHPATAPAPVPNTPAALLGVLSNPTADVPQSQRDEAARRLVAMDTPEAENALQQALIDPRNPRGQLAVARALAEDPTPNAVNVIPLGALIGGDSALTEAAARALAHLRDNPDARIQLIDAATNRPLPLQSRLAVIRALTPLADKRAAQVLVDLLVNNPEPRVRNAAAAELVEMTGLTGNGNDAGRWRQWWAARQPMPDAQFEQEMLAARAARLDRLEPRFERLVEEIGQHLRENFQDVPAANKEHVLMGYLRSSASEVRQIGAEIILDLFSGRAPIPPSAAQELRTMVGDSDEQVRLRAAAAIRAINDKEALDAVLAQLAVEPVAGVRAALAAALAPMGSPRAVKPLLALLQDPDPVVVQAGAEALRSLKERLGAGDPQMAAEISRALNAAVRRAGSGAEAMQLRRDLVEAMVAWASPEPEVRNTFVSLLRLNETPEMREFALQYFGQMGSDLAWPADTIVNSDALDASDPRVRSAAVNALARTAKAEHAQRLFERLSPEVEPVAAVREEAWLAMVGLFQREFGIDQLYNWADKFLDSPERRLTVLETLRDKMIAARRTDDLPIVRQNIGETCIKLGQYGKAATEFRLALEVLRRGAARDLLVTQLIDAYVRDGNYEQATRFGASMIAENRQYMSTIRPALMREVERLRKAGETEQALRLVGLALKMDPPLAEDAQVELRNIEARLRQATTEPATP